MAFRRLPLPASGLFFDAEVFFRELGEPDYAPQGRAQCASLWCAWTGLLSVYLVESPLSCLALWLGKDVEDAVDAAWAESPSHAFRLDRLAAALCAAALRAYIPGVALYGCAPLPPFSTSLAAALSEAGLPCAQGESLVPLRRYAVVTYYGVEKEPHTCEHCALKAGCPHLLGKNETS